MNRLLVESAPFDGRQDSEALDFKDYSVDPWWFIGQSEQDPEAVKRAAQLADMEFNQLVNPVESTSL